MLLMLGLGGGPDVRGPAADAHDARFWGTLGNNRKRASPLPEEVPLLMA